MRRSGVQSLILAAVLLLLIAVGIASSLRHDSHERDSRPHVRGVIELGLLADTSHALLTGYNYHLLRRYAEDNGKTVDIKLVRRGEGSYLDSLKSGAIDILVVPFDTLDHSSDSVLASAAFDSISVWLTAHDEHRWLKEINEWIGEWHTTDDYRRLSNLFLVDYNPMKKRGVRDFISPYDTLFKMQADSLGLDWHFLAAIAWHESRFHIEVHSHRGASGIMQLMPSTGKSLGAVDLTDPRQSISAAAHYIHKLGRHYRRVADGERERLRMVLAAYNAGETRIDDCVHYARFRDVDPGKWENIVSLIPEMNDSSTVAASGVVKLGVFKGVETIAYVDKVMSIYDYFCKVCPDR